MCQHDWWGGRGDPPGLDAVQVQELELGQLLDEVHHQLHPVLVQPILEEGVVGRQADAHFGRAHLGSHGLRHLAVAGMTQG